MTGRGPWEARGLEYVLGPPRETPPLARVLIMVGWAAHLGAGGHGDVQVAENVLGVLILHRLAEK